jgi:AcrR family transcriptional regulator
MRLHISHLATNLFMEKGFDNVTVDEIAAAANVSKMTVFNYFARKEDLLFDRNEETLALLRTRFAARTQAPIPALKAFVLDLVEAKHPLVRMTPPIAAFWKVVADSPALREHTRTMAAELERDLARMLAAAVGQPVDPLAKLIATLLVGTWRVAFRESLRSRSWWRETFLDVIDRGFAAATTAARGTAYVR